MTSDTPFSRAALGSLLGSAALLAVLAACTGQRVARTVCPTPEASVTAPPPASGPTTRVRPSTESRRPTSAAVHDADAPLHNYRRFSERLSSGASPETEADFAYLATQGVKTIVTVDGARPDVLMAWRYHLRYVHIPIGYDGIPREKQLLLAKTFQDLPEPFYVHCHHGKHRGPTACMIGRILLDGIDAAQAVADMKGCGTDPKYRGLYAVPRTFRKPTAEELAATPADFPSSAKVGDLQAAMVDIDASWERLKAAKKASWKPMADHPDVVASHEATILAEHFRELARTDDVTARGDDFRRLLKVSEDAAWELAAAAKPDAVDAKRAAKAFDAGAESCANCHVLHRDNN